MEQFTANDKKPLFDSDIDPKRIKSVADGLRRQGEFESARMLHAYADLLDARERAVPVYQHRRKNGSMLRWFDCSEETFMAMEHNEHDRKHFDRRILYTHPASADAERLAEALRGILEIGKRNMENQKYDGFFNAAREALAAHSAQAQPPAASVTFAAPETEEDVMAYLQIAKLHIKRFRETLQAALASQENHNG